MNKQSNFLANLLKQSNGRIVTVTFVKKDGSIRKLNGRLGVKAYRKTDGSTTRQSINDVTGHPYITIFDMQKRGYRSVNPDTILSLKMDGVEMQVPQSNGKTVKQQPKVEPVKFGPIKWNGGDCPVDPNTRVKVELNNEGNFYETRAGTVLWDHSKYLTDACAHVTSYEVVK